MTERLVRLLVLGLLTYAAMALVRHLYFSDVQPIAFAPDTQAAWRVDAAVSITAVAFVGAVVAAIAAFCLAATIWQQLRRGVS